MPPKNNVNTVDRVFFVGACFLRLATFFFKSRSVIPAVSSFFSPFLFFVKSTHFESLAACYFRGMDANRKNRENKAPAKKPQSTVDHVENNVNKRTL